MYCTLDTERLSLHLDNGAVAIVTGEEGGVYCGGHQDDSEVRVHTNHFTKNYQNEVSLVGKGLKIKFKTNAFLLRTFWLLLRSLCTKG